MSKSVIGVFVSAIAAGAIAGGSVALYGLIKQSRLPSVLSQHQAASVSTLFAVVALVLVALVLRWLPDQRKSMSTEDSVLAIVAGVATIALVAASLTLLQLAPTMPQLWLLPAICCATLAALLAVLPIGLGLLHVSEWVPDQSTVKAR